MTTRVYGASDDLIEFEGDVYGEVGCYGTDDQEHGVLVICSDGTLMDVKYGKGDQGIWGITLIKQGDLFDKIVPCDDENARPHSDVAHFKDGLKWCYAAKEWEKVR
jgi:uncharacterized protein (DUF2237 family)